MSDFERDIKHPNGPEASWNDLESLESQNASETLLKESKQPKYRVRLFAKPLILVVAVVLLLVNSSRLSGIMKGYQNEHDPFHILRPDPVWTPCGPENFYCSNLSLPLDYDNRDAGNFSLAIIKYSDPSVAPEQKLGTLMFNPGGPGLSGVEVLKLVGHKISAYVDHKYEIVAFDPRGIGKSLPIRCFNENDLIDDIIDFPLMSDCETGPGKVYKNKEAYAHSCGLKEFYAKYISTPLVATDMLYIAKHMGQDKVNYWGFSYGSVIGNTFAQLYPENMGRMIIDGVVDVEDYYEGLHFDALVDIDALQFKFFEECVKSGRDSCPFESDDAEEIQAQVLQLLKNLKKEPFVVTRPSQVSELDEHGNLRPTYVTVNYLWILDRLFGALYTPSTWKSTAQLFQALLKRDNDALIYDAFAWRTLGSIGERYKDNGGYLTLCGDSFGGAVNNAGGDYSGLEVDVKGLTEHYHKMQTASSELYSAIWMTNVCVNSRVKPVWTLSKDAFENQQVNGSMLVISNAYDPVTPLANGKKAVEYYSDGALLIQDGYGHTSLAEPSECTTETVRAWLVDGVLPESGQICATDHSPFDVAALAREEARLVTHRDTLMAPYYFG